MKAKTISGHYDTVFDLDHNNRNFIPENVDVTRTWRNNYLVTAGETCYMDLTDLRFVPDFWEHYRNLSDIYWSDRALAREMQETKFRKELQWIKEHRIYYNPSYYGLAGLVLTVLFLPMLIAHEVYLDERYRKAMEEWREYKWEQRLRDIQFNARRQSLRDALREYDLQAGNQCLQMMDTLVKEVAWNAGDYFNASDRYVIAPNDPPRFATLEEIYEKLYEPAFREFQDKQRPCRRYEGTYLEYIREGQRTEVHKKKQNRNSRSRKIAEAIEMVFGIGDMDDTGYAAAWADAVKSEEILTDFCDHLLQSKNICFVTTKELEQPDWQPPFCNGLIVLNLSAHYDEATPGVHMTCIPYSRNCKRGPAVQASLGRALTGMGYPSTWKDVLDGNGNPIPKRDRNGNVILNKDGSIRYKQEPDKTGIIDWIEDQKRWLQEQMLERYGWEREYKGSHPRGNLSTPDYKTARAEERRQEIERQLDTMMQNVMEHIDEKIDRLDESVDKVWEEAGDKETILRYLNICSAEERDKLFSYARERLDSLPQREREYIQASIDEIISKSENQVNGQKQNSHPKETALTEYG